MTDIKSKLPTGPLTMNGTVEVTLSEIEEIVKWYVTEFHNLEFQSSSWGYGSNGSPNRYRFQFSKKTVPEEQKVAKPNNPSPTTSTIEIE